jgi:hypothetical protein
MLPDDVIAFQLVYHPGAVATHPRSEVEEHIASTTLSDGP